MASIEPGTFTRYSLTEQEIISGSVLSAMQKMMIQNECADIADQILGLQFDPRNSVKFAQDEAFLKGQLSVLRVLLIRSQETESKLSNPDQN
jgi:hypothetical protein